jgi:hypothetical protein
MAQHQSQSGVVNISGGNVNVGGDLVGRDKITSVHHQLSKQNLREINRMFAHILHRIDVRPGYADKTELKNVVSSIEREVKKGEAAETSNVKHWLLTLAAMADDIYQVTILALTNPFAGVAKGIQTLARHLKQETDLRP